VNGFLVPPDDVEALAECIKKLLADEKLARDLGRRGRDFVARNFSTARYVAGYAEIVEYVGRLVER
jgi:glycosyltransferase involved in cell wall biosynthesis